MQPVWVENESASSSGRFILSEQRHRRICRKNCRIDRILDVSGLAGKRTLRAVDLKTPDELSPQRFPQRSM